MHVDLKILSGRNTYGKGASADYVGRFKQDEAAMRRFAVVYIDYDKRVERLIGDAKIVEKVWAIRAACEALQLKHIVSTRSIAMATDGKQGGGTMAHIDAAILYAGLPEETKKQVTSQMAKARREEV